MAWYLYFLIGIPLADYIWCRVIISWKCRDVNNFKFCKSDMAASKIMIDYVLTFQGSYFIDERTYFIN